ncbi:unnamed protein product [Lupinus luteus]|uniref:Uncharacterized protein n=1 Tax=Lupinus luteus TaxID=3873 RepID=A0AAV1YBG3_LUPLU
MKMQKNKNKCSEATNALKNDCSEANMFDRETNLGMFKNAEGLEFRFCKEGMLQKETDEPVKIAPESEMARPENPNRNIGVSDKEINNHDSPENSQRARNVDDERFRDNLHDKDHRDWLIDVHQKRPCNEEPSSGHEDTNLIVKEGEKILCDVNDSGLVGEVSRRKLTTKNKANGSNNIHHPRYIGIGMYFMMPVRMVSPNHLQFIEDSDAEPPDNNPLETIKGDCIVLSIHNEENMELVPETQGTMMKEDEGQETLMVLGSP